MFVSDFAFMDNNLKYLHNAASQVFCVVIVVLGQQCILLSSIVEAK